jgi:hypothetical protein
MTNPKDSAA